MFGMDLVVTVASTSLALVAAMLVAKTPAGLPFLALPVMIAFGGYRAYVREHERHKKVEFLYQANRSLADSPEVAVAVEGLLGGRARRFGAEQAEVILFGSEGTRRRCERASVRPGSGEPRAGRSPGRRCAARAGRRAVPWRSRLPCRRWCRNSARARSSATR